MNAPIAVYYAQAGDRVYIDTSLKHLLARSGLRPAVDRAAAAQFMRYGAVFGQATLLTGIHKLAPNKALEVSDGPRQYGVMYGGGQMDLETAKSRWEDVIEDSICACARGGEEANIAVSSGYDSNYILYCLNKAGEAPIHLYTLGAHRGVSEIEVVEDNAACYAGAQLTTGYTAQGTLDHFEDIVWRLEGAVFEAGIFLQYELGRLLSAGQKDHAICGDCADQVMHEDFCLNQAQIPDPCRACVTQDPYAYGAAIVVKKSGIILGSFGVEGRYPYIDLRVAALCQALKPLNKKGKLFHKGVCEKRLPTRVLRHISKLGGSTSLHSLFDDQRQIDAFFTAVEESAAFVRYADLIPQGQAGNSCDLLGKLRRFIGSEPNLRLLMAKIWGKLLVTPPDHYKADYRRQERKLNDFMRLHYLGTFERLFVEEFLPQRITEPRPARFISDQLADTQAKEKNLPGKSCVA